MVSGSESSWTVYTSCDPYYDVSRLIPAHTSNPSGGPRQDNAISSAPPDNDMDIT
jgi:hypothetical protein